MILRVVTRVLFAASIVVACWSTVAQAATIEHYSVGDNGAGNGNFQSIFEGASADGTKVFFRTDEALTSADTDTFPDIYERGGGVTTLLSIGPTGGNGTYTPFFRAASADGKHVIFESNEPLVAADADGTCYDQQETSLPCYDVYDRSGGTTTLISTGPNGATGDFNARYRGMSRDGTHVFFTTREQLVPADTDNAQDVYERVGNTTNLVSTGPSGGNGDFDAQYRGVSDDGSRVFFSTTEQLTPNDTDSNSDVYERSGGTTTLLSTGATSGNGPQDATYTGSSSDGSRVFFETAEQLTASDTDTNIDVYQRSAGTTTLFSTGPAGGNGAKDASFTGASKDGTRVWFETPESLVSGDTDGRRDVYERSGGTTTLVSTGPSGGSGPYDASFEGASDDGSRVWIGTFEPLAPTDTDSAFDIYERSGGTTTQVSIGPAGNGPSDSFFDGASADGTHVWFDTFDSLVSSDTDSYQDVYQRYQGTTTLLTPGPSGTTTSYAPFVGASADGARVFFASGDKLTADDTDSQTDVYGSVDTLSYARPKGATPLLVPLVIAYRDCTAANRTHGAPLAFPSCAPPVPESNWLTIGTADANGAPTKSIGSVRLDTIPGDPSTTADEADVALHASVTDVRRQSDLSDYPGELQTALTVRITDKLNGSAPVDAGTVQDVPFNFTVPCSPTGDATVGSTCAANTTADAVVPGSIAEGKRAIWELGQVQVYDGGADGDVDTAPNTLFEREGIFVP